MDSRGHTPVASSTPTKWRIIPNRRLKSKKAKEKGKALGQAVAFYFYLRLSLRALFEASVNQQFVHDVFNSDRTIIQLGAVNVNFYDGRAGEISLDQRFR